MRAVSIQMALAIAMLARVAVAQGQDVADVAAQPSAGQQVLAEHSEIVRRHLERNGIAILPADADDPFVRALVLFEQPRRRVIRLLSQTARHQEFRPELKEVEAHAWDDKGALDTHRMKIMFMRIEYRLRTNFDWPASRIWWELDPEFDNDLAEVEGFWELFEIDPRNTLGRFGTRVSVGPNMPAWLQETATRKQVPQTMENVRLWVNSDGTFRP